MTMMIVVIMMLLFCSCCIVFSSIFFPFFSSLSRSITLHSFYAYFVSFLLLFCFSRTSFVCSLKEYFINAIKKSRESIVNGAIVNKVVCIPPVQKNCSSKIYGLLLLLERIFFPFVNTALDFTK